jgi:hypothetical protein
VIEEIREEWFEFDPDGARCEAGSTSSYGGEREVAATWSLKLEAHGEEIAGSLLRGRIFLAADRPDRLEVTRLDDGSGAPFPLEPGDHVTASIRGTKVFTGEIDRVGHGLDPHAGRTSTIVAYAEFHRLRESGRQHWYQVTDSEAAERVAASLGLSVLAEPTRASTHGSRSREILSRSFEAARVRAATTGCPFGRLYFAATCRRSARRCRRRIGHDVVSFSLEERGGPVGTLRGGRLCAIGDPRWAPLGEVEMKSLELAAPFGIGPSVFCTASTGAATGPCRARGGGLGLCTVARVRGGGRAP